MKKINHFLSISRSYLWKVSAIFIFITISINAYSQNQKVSLSSNPITIQAAFEQIEKQSKFTIAYNESTLDVNKQISVNISNKPLNEALVLVLSGTGASYVLKANQIIIIPEPSSKSSEKKYKGVILDDMGQTVIGASIKIKGSLIGTITDALGTFELQAPSKSVLVISYLGFVTQEVILGERSDVQIILIEDNTLLDEVVVVGYGTQKKVNLSGSVSVVNIAKEATGRPMTALSAGLAGLVPGLYVNTSSNDPGSSANLLLRGQGSLNNSAPLVIVDGVESNMDFVSPHDVASISVLKDAASASIYGSRAANGVILITTKQGAEGKIQISYNAYGSFQSVSNLMPLVDNSVEYMEMQNEAARNSNIKEHFSKENIDLWRANQGGDPLLWPNTNWGKSVFRNVFTNNHNLSVSGGTSKLKTHVSFDYSDSPGIIEKTGYTKYVLRANNQLQITPWLLVGANLSGIMTDKERGSNNLESMFQNSVGAVPTVVVRSPDGRYGGTNNVEDNQLLASPLYYLNSIKGDNTTHRFNSKFSVNINPLEGFNVNASYYYDFGTNKISTLPVQNDRWNFQTNSILVSGKGVMNISKSEQRDSKNFMDASASYNKTVLDKLNFQIMGGASQEQYFIESFAVTRQDLIDEQLTEIGAANGTSTSSGTRQEWAMRSFFGRLNLNWDDKYLVGFNIRRDGSSRFIPKNRWGNFPSASVAWRISEEGFMASFKDTWLDNLKVRASYGKLGNNSIGNYDAIPLLSLANYVINNTPSKGFYQAAIANVDVTWESTAVANIGLDFGILNNRLNGTLEWYDKTTSDILMNLPAPDVHGTAKIPPINAAKVRNRGIEINIGWQDKIGDLNYSISSNFTYNKNKVLKFKGDEYSLNGTSMIREGLPINVQYLRIVDRIVETSQDLAIIQSMIDNAPLDDGGNKRNPFPYGRPELGDFLYKDLNNDGLINDDDRTVYGSGSNPKFMYGFSLGLEYKGFDFSALLQGIGGIEEYFQNEYYSPVVRPSIIINKEIVDGRWYEGRTSPAKYPRLMNADTRNTKESDFWVQDKSFFKIRNIQVGYSLPKTILTPLKVEKLRVYTGLENFFTFTSYKGLDPEIYGVSYPSMKQVVIGVNLSF